MDHVRIRTIGWLMGLCLLVLAACSGGADAGVDDLEVPGDAVARVVFFAAPDCELCDALIEDLLSPLQERCDAGLQIKYVDVSAPEGYEAFVETETLLVGESGRWEIPAVVVEDKAFVGESAIRIGLLSHLECVFGDGGNAWPAGDALALIDAPPTPTPVAAAGANPFGGTAEDSLAGCVDDEASAVCASPSPIFALYLSGSDCTDTCDRTRYDLIYLKGVFPQLSFEERSIEENYELAAALGKQLGVPEDQWRSAPAVIVGEDYLVGETLLLENLRERLETYTESGATALWYLIDLP